ncbi:aminotransferase class IV [Halomonas denitrificans]|nr:aminotransferase class IV [Halomonas denitrificans]
MNDRGLLYGDGLFETIAFHRGRAALWSLHMERLATGCRRLDIPMPDADRLHGEAVEAVGAEKHAAVRITLTRGPGGRAYRPPADATPNRILAARRLPEDLERQRSEGIAMITAPFRLPAEPLLEVPGQPPGSDPLQGMKHLNRLPQVLIGVACRDAGVEEALVLDQAGRLVEALTGNVVIERRGRLVAPGPHPWAIAGVGLAWLRREAGATLEERVFDRQELEPDDAIWVLNSVQGIRPVVRLDGEARGSGSTLREWQRRWVEFVER